MCKVGLLLFCFVSFTFQEENPEIKDSFLSNCLLQTQGAWVSKGPGISPLWPCTYSDNLNALPCSERTTHIHCERKDLTIPFTLCIEIEKKGKIQRG